MKTRILYLLLFVCGYAFSQTPTNGLLANYELNNGNFNDTSGNAVHFTKTGTQSVNTTDALSVAGNALYLGGDYLTRSDLNFTTNTGHVNSDNTVTHSFFMKMGGTSQSNKITIIDDSERTGITFTGNETGYYIYVKDGKIGATARVLYNSSFTNQALRGAAINDFLSTRVIQDNNWHHIVVRISQTYINQPASTTLRYGLDIEITVDAQTEFNRDEFLASLYITDGIDSSGNVTIGNNRNQNIPVTDRYEDEIDNVLMYNRVLTNTEVINIYDTGIPPIYVAADATGSNDGTSWVNAYTSLQDALAVVKSNQTIWIKRGTYKPHTSDKGIPFLITKENVKIYGGFAGTETAINQRVLGANETILSGDLNGDDVNQTTYASNFNNTTRQDNSLRIIDIRNTGNNLLLDGLTISDAHNTSDSSNGVAIVKSSSVAKLTIRNSIFKNNVSGAGGAGISAEFNLNSTSIVGELTIENCQFTNNMGRWASGVYGFTRSNTDVNVNISNSLFSGNIAADNAVHKGDTGSSMFFINLSGNNTSDLNIGITNCTFVNNQDTGTTSPISSTQRATLVLAQANVNTTPTNAIVSNCVFWGNRNVGGSIARSITDSTVSPLTSLVVRNSIDEANFNDSSITSKTNTSTANPLFVDAINSNFTLQTTSPAVNSGNNADVTTTKDLAGNTRILNTTVDMGCYERELICGDVLNIQLAKSNTNPSNAVISWDHIVNNTGPFDLIYVESGQPTSSGTLVTGITTNSYEVSSLDFNTLYDIYVRSHCGNTAGAYVKTTGIVNVIHFVDSTATGQNNGISWTNAFTTLESALVAVQNDEQIWIKGGTYHPHASDRTVSYNITKQNVKVYGGFAGTEAKVQDRVIGANETILSGDLNNNDTFLTNYPANYMNTTRSTDNSYHIITITATGNNLLLDGLTISDAHYNDTSSNVNGAAILKDFSVADLTLKNCIIKDNVAKTGGAGLAASYNLNSTSIVGNLIIENCQFINNMSRYASGIYSFIQSNTDVNITVTNSLFRNNTAADLGNANRGLSGSAMWLRNISGNNTSDLNIGITNCTFTGNIDTGTDASSNTNTRGTVLLSQGSVNTTPTNAVVSNCIFWGNKTTSNATTRSITDLNKSPLTSLIVSNSIDEANFNDSSISSKTNTNNSNPLFTDVANNDFTLQSGSPAIDAGDNTKIPSGITTDLLGNRRIFNTTVDIGTYEFGTLPATTTWTGAVNLNWNNPSNWDNGVPNSSLSAIIPNIISGFNLVRIVGRESVKDLEIAAGKTLTIDIAGGLTIEGNLVQNGTLTINSSTTSNGSLILKGTQSGTGLVQYNRNVSNNWHLISPPVVGQNLASFKNDVTTNGIKYAIATYDNGLSSSRYNYYTTAAGANNINTAGNFLKGKGYSAKRTGAGTFSFSGMLNTTDVAIGITDGSATGNKWNLIGNPFTASMSGNVNADVTNNFLTVNASQLDPARVAMYVWNAGTSSYDIINQASATKYIAPGQGFFVEAKNGGGTVQFTEEMQTHQTGNIFSKGSAHQGPSIKLTVSEGKNVKSTEVKYLNNTTIDLDPGYDAGVFSGGSNTFGVYTQLVSKNNKTNFALQCLPNKEYESMVIPVGVSLKEDKKITFSVTSLNLPSDIKVYLEDTHNNTFTQIDKQSYTASLTVNESKIGRFYLHTIKEKLSNIPMIEEDDLNVFVSNNKLNVITKKQGKEVTLKIMDVLGKEVYTKTFTSKGRNELELPKVSIGMYIVRLTTEHDKLIKKVIID